MSNKFFYTKVGKEHCWIDRLIWTDKQWLEYSTDKKIKSYVLVK